MQIVRTNRMNDTNPIRGKVVYLSGPMSGIEDLNRPAFAKAESRAYELGARFVFNPCEHWVHSDRPSEWYMRHDLHMLTCSECGDGDGIAFDVLLALPGYMMSRGARCEAFVAMMSGIEVVRYSDLLGVRA